MKLTERQQHLLAHLDQIECRKTSLGQRGYFLGKELCTSTINSLIVKGIVTESADRKRLRRTRLVLQNG